jgi:hypothetical protein
MLEEKSANPLICHYINCLLNKMYNQVLNQNKCAFSSKVFGKHTSMDNIAYVEDGCLLGCSTM